MTTKIFKKYFEDKRKKFEYNDQYLMALNDDFYNYEKEMIQEGLEVIINTIYKARYDYIRFLLECHGFNEKQIAKDLNISMVMLKIYIKGKLKSIEVNNWLLEHIGFCFD